MMSSFHWPKILISNLKIEILSCSDWFWTHWQSSHSLVLPLKLLSVICTITYGNIFVAKEFVHKWMLIFICIYTWFCRLLLLYWHTDTIRFYPLLFTRITIYIDFSIVENLYCLAKLVNSRFSRLLIS